LRTQGQALIGNRLALAGAIIYLLEWVGIIGFNTGNVPAAQGAKAADVVAQYTQHGTGVELLAGWLSLVLLGRILFVAGIRDGLRKSGAETLLADFAFGAMAVSVIIEIGAFAVAGVRCRRCQRGRISRPSLESMPRPTGSTGDRCSFRRLGFGCLVRSAEVAPVSGVAVLAGHCRRRRPRGGWGDHGPGVRRRRRILSVVQTLSFAVLAAWVWMIATGVILLRAAVRKPPLGEGV